MSRLTALIGHQPIPSSVITDLYLALGLDKIAQPSYIAGGAAVSYDLSSDIDIWILDSDMGQGLVDDLRQRILNSDFKLDWATKDNDKVDYPKNGKFIRVGEIDFEGHIKPVQIFLAGYDTILELLDHFDVSTHNVAIDMKTHVRILHETYTLPGAMAKVTAWHTPLRTLWRLIRLNQRYEQPTNWDDLIQLCCEVAKLQGYARYGVEPDDQPF